MDVKKSYVGIDVSKRTFDVAIDKDEAILCAKFTNNVEGFEEFMTFLATEKKKRVVMESSGCEIHLASYLYAHHIKVSVINPLIPYRFRQLQLKRTKTDKADAKIILQYGKLYKPPFWKPLPQYIIKLRQMEISIEKLYLFKRILSLQKKSFHEQNIHSKESIAFLDKTMLSFEENIEEMETIIERSILSRFQQMFDNLMTIPGLGKKTIISMLLVTNGFKRFSSSKKLCCYLGITPRMHESGTSVKGKTRITKMGMKRLRSLLFICSWAAKRSNPSCMWLYNRLIKRGKAKRQAYIAVCNKLVRQAFAVAKTGQPYQPNHMTTISVQKALHPYVFIFKNARSIGQPLTIER